jgi:hypothetical protein
MILSVFAPQCPAVAITPEATWEGAMNTHSTFLYSFPLFVEVSQVSMRIIEHVLTRAHIDLVS